ncbi:MAG: tetratricopeptide repeat protein [Bacteroidaceae bacterium]|nr:tetratricopeptide repeat protein [Bacteroidaceae bacterium]
MKRILVFSLIFLWAGAVWAQQRSDRSFVRHGNRMFEDSLFIKAEENYLKAVDINPDLYEGVYNLGNAYTAQQKPNEAVEQYRRAANSLEARKRTLMEDPGSDPKEINRCKDALAKTYHNTGVVYHMSEQYDKAVEYYKQALRNNPDDDETRYNMILAQRMLKQQQQNQQQEQQQQKQDQQQQEQQQEQQQNEDQQEEQQQQQQEQPEEMSQENAEQILDAAMQDEKDVQDRVMEQLLKAQPKKPLEKDW